MRRRRLSRGNLPTQGTLRCHCHTTAYLRVGRRRLGSLWGACLRLCSFTYLVPKGTTCSIIDYSVHSYDTLAVALPTYGVGVVNAPTIGQWSQLTTT